ncbi:MAG: transposase [Ignavibacteriae bacterium]|nr:transposase [Ignavibacteriota bacterium]
MAIADGASTPVASYLAAASPGECTLVTKTLRHTFTRQKPERLLGDKAYDSDPLDEELRAHGVRLISPHKRNRVRPKTQDGRELRRYKRRWTIERLFAWLGHFRHLVVRYDYHLRVFETFVMLGMIVVLLRRLWN